MSLISERKVHHIGPTSASLFIVGDSPGKHDNLSQVPFSGPSGDLLNMALDNVGINRDDIRFGNVLNYEPARNIYAFGRESWQLTESKRELLDYCENQEHKVIIPMGPKALEFFTGYTTVDKCRGSVYSYKKTLVVPTVHPYSVRQDGGLTPAFLHDLAKAQRLTTGWTPPVFNFKVNPSFYEAEAHLPLLLASERLWCDIESVRGTTYIRCMGFAWSPVDAICIFNDATEGIGPNFGRFLRAILSSDVPKTFHNGAFDTHFLRINGIEVTNWDYDTMLMQHSLQPELPLGLAYCTSLYTDINYYKADGKDTSGKITKEALGIYNCKDVVATCQVELAQKIEVDDVSLAMFKNKFSQVVLASEISTCGLFIDQERLKELGTLINSNTTKAYSSLFGLMEMLGMEEADYFRVSQHAKVKWFLYDKLQLPIKQTMEGKTSGDEDAIVSLIGFIQSNMQKLKTDAALRPWRIKMLSLKLILEIRGLEKLLSSYIEAEQSPDGRHRSVYNITGTETNRWSASSWYDGTGLNGQTIPRVSI